MAYISGRSGTCTIGGKAYPITEIDANFDIETEDIHILGGGYLPIVVPGVGKGEGTFTFQFNDADGVPFSFNATAAAMVINLGTFSISGNCIVTSMGVKKGGKAATTPLTHKFKATSPDWTFNLTPQS